MNGRRKIMLKQIFYKSPMYLKDLCFNKLLENKNFVKYYNHLPQSIRRALIYNLMNSDEYDNLENDINIDKITNWFDITFDQFVDILYCNKNVLFHNDDESVRRNLIWREKNGQCYDCNGGNCLTYYKLTKAECAYCCDHVWCSTMSVNCENLNNIIFNVNNWCNKCLVKPLFNILQNAILVTCDNCYYKYI
ncbi:ORF-4 [Catopsilia pomona nucleopolyhedrovirus]|uniref:ORF-4 n=1 Tax=Catopsilia pomona nucleopolyhedrovirus TaxID=1850906 RepID=A0A172WZ83_9ABAC|nr:ORF-4 [Catopsilia pomona nucleopolyhedrovirus]ANF29653.1 ORF-4 [Catopsilia pomona nucleopolyhedrovirus]